MESKVADERNVIVLGSGPAGYTAALYAARADLQPLVLKGLDAGGQLMLTTDVENYPGFPGGILGPELMNAMEKQASRFGAEMLHQSATRVDLSSRPFGVWSGDEEWRARTLLIATGASARWLGIPGEDRLRGRGVWSTAGASSVPRRSCRTARSPTPRFSSCGTRRCRRSSEKAPCPRSDSGTSK